MPRHTDKTMRIKHDYSQPLPKSLSEYSDIVNEKFKDNHLAEIEEADNMNFLTNKFKIWFHNQQKYHSNIKNKDGFFTKLKNYVEMDMKSSILACGFIINPYMFGGLIGTTLTCGNGSSGTSAFNVGEIYCQKPNTGTYVVGSLYNQIALSCGNSTGNMKQGVYDDSGSNPNNLLAQITSRPLDSAFTLQSITEFTLTTNPIWIAASIDNASSTFYYQDYGSNDARRKAATYATNFLNPVGAGLSSNSAIIYCKIGHT